MSLASLCTNCDVHSSTVPLRGPHMTCAEHTLSPRRGQHMAPSLPCSGPRMAALLPSPPACAASCQPHSVHSAPTRERALSDITVTPQLDPRCLARGPRSPSGWAPGTHPLSPPVTCSLRSSSTCGWSGRSLGGITAATGPRQRGTWSCASAPSRLTCSWTF